MAKTKISEFNANPALNTDIDSINISEGCAPSGINDAIRELMSQLKDWQSGTSNDPMVIGSTGSLTLNQGTANGVAYLNGSKVVTSGSALTFSGSALGVNATSTDASMSIQALTANYASVLSLVANNDNGAQYNNISSSTSGGTVHWRIGGVAGTSQLPFSVGGSEGMRLTSTGLGIGTSSPASKLQVTASSSSGTSGADGARFNAGGNVAINIGAESSSGYGWIQSANWGSGYINTAINPNGGNVGIGTSSPSSILHVVGSGNPTINLAGSAGGYTSIFNMNAAGGGASKINAVGGTNALIFQTNTTDRATLDSSGNLGLGVTPSAWDADFKAVQIQRAAVSSYNNVIAIFSQNNYADKYIASSLAASKYQQNAGAHSWFTAASGTAGNAITFTQAMTLDASGNLGVGTTSPSSVSNYGAMTINGTNGGLLDVKYGNTLAGRIVGSSGSFGIEVGGTSYFNVYTNNTERARIDSSGNLLVGTTTGGAKICVDGSASVSSRVASFRSRTSGDTAYGCGLFSKYTNDSSTSQVFVQFSINNDTVTNGQINGNGANQAAFGSWSDSRLKENIVNLPSQLSNIMALRPVEFDYIQSEGGGHQTGFIAQEMETVFPDAVGERFDGMKTVTGWGKTEAILVKAIQELKAEFDAYKASHP